MPFFDFSCEECGHTFNVRVSNAEKHKVRCPACDTQKIRQLLSPFFAPGSAKGDTQTRPAAMPGCCAGCKNSGMGCGM
ncbi:MAG: FmdB family zinc ribbon protein [Solirubrobacterales bacterium]